MSRSAPHRGSYHHGDLLNSLVEHAHAVAEEVGPGGVSVREVARRAGVSHAAAYHHFADKRDLLRAVAFDALAELQAKIAEGAVAADAAGALTGVGRAYLGFALERPAAFSLIWDKALCLPKGQPDPLMQAQLGLAAEVEAVFERHAAEFTSLDPEARSFTVWSLLHGFAAIAAETPIFTGRSREDLEVLLGRIVTSALSGIGASANQPRTGRP